MRSMRLGGFWMVAVLCMATVGFAQSQDPADDPDLLASFGEVIGVEVMNVEVRVTDSDGSPVLGLERGDFTLTVDGESTPISNFYAVEERVRREEATDSEVASDSDPVSPVDEAPTDDALFLVVLIDDLHLAPFNRNQKLDELYSVLDDLMDPGDRVMVARSTNVVETIVSFTDDLEEVREGIDVLRDMASFGVQNEERHRATIEDMLQLHDAYEKIGTPCPNEMGMVARTFMASVRDEVQTTAQALEGFVGSLESVPGRRALMMVSDGLPADPGAPIAEWVREFCGGSGAASGLQQATDVSNASLAGDYYTPSAALSDALNYRTEGVLDEVIERANASDVTIFSLEAYGPRPAGRQVRLDQRASTANIEFVRVASFQDGLNTLADGTGGKALFNMTKADPRLAKIDEDLDSYYSIGFLLDEETGDIPMRIDVDVAQPGLTVRHRRSVTRKDADQKLADRTRGALNFELVDNRLDIAVDVAEPLPMDESLFLVPLRIRIPIARVEMLEQGDVHRGQMSLFVAARDRSGREAPVRSADIPLVIPGFQIAEARTQDFLYEVKMLMRSGDHAVAIGLRDEVAGTASYVVENVLVKPPSVGGE